MTEDVSTAAAFAESWNHLPEGSVYTREQFEDWFEPLKKADIEGKSVLELGCGNGSLLVHIAGWGPSSLEGVDLGASVDSAKGNMELTGFTNWKITQADLVSFSSPGHDIVYCIGVLHHLKKPQMGFEAVLANVKPGGRFHCWVYAREGNGVIIWIVDPIRKVASLLPWWFTKYAIATPLVVPYYLYAKLLKRFQKLKLLHKLPLFEYSMWIAEREFSFFRHVAFDQLVTPQTTYLPGETIESWLKDSRIDPESTYVIFRNGNSWKFGGCVR